MSGASEESSSESGGIMDWALVDSHGDLEDGDSSSTTSSVEVMPEQEEEPGSNPVTGSPTGPKFVLRLASREHLAPDSDEELVETGRGAGESTSFDVIPSQSTQDQNAGLYSSSAPASSSSAASMRGIVVSDQRLPPKFSQQISREHIEDLVQAITEVQSSVSLSDGRTGEQSKSIFGNSVTQESQAVIGDLDTESVNSSVSSRFSYLTGEQNTQEPVIPKQSPLNMSSERLTSNIDLDTESIDSSISSRFSFLTQERGNVADLEESDTERYAGESVPVVESVGAQEDTSRVDVGTTHVLFRSPSFPVQEENGVNNSAEPERHQRPADDNIVQTIRRLDRMFNISVVFVCIILGVNYFYGFYYISGVGKCKPVENQYGSATEQIEKVAALKAVIKKQDEQINILQHQHLVQQNRLEKSLEKCKINLNDAEQENSDLKSEVIRLKYSVQHVEEKVKQEPEVSKVANGDTPYIQCGPGKVMKRHHEVDGDTMYFCDWDKNQVIPNEEEKPTKPVDEDVLAIESFCNKIMTANELDEERLFSRRYKKLKKNFFPVCRKALKQERPEDPNINQQPVEDDTIPCQSCYQKLSQAENNWLKAENEKEAAVSRSELWKDLYTKAIEREAERNKVDEESQEPDSEGDEREVKQEPVSLQSCWKFVVANLTAGNHLFESFGLYWEEVENLMPTNFSSLFDFWIHAKWRKPPEDEDWQDQKTDDEDDEGPWTGSDTGEDDMRSENQFDWGDTVNNVLNKTRESVTTVNKQIQDTWKQVKNMSKQLWKKHEPTIVKMHNSFSEKLSKLGEKFQEKLRKKTEHWFKRSQKGQGKRGKNGQDSDVDGQSRNTKQQERQKRKQEEKAQKLKAKEEKQKKKAERREAREEKAEGRNEENRRKPHLDVGGAASDLFEDEHDYDYTYQEVPNIHDNYEEILKAEALGVECTAKFEKLRKAANNLKWRAKNIDAWNNLEEEYRAIGARLMMYDMYQLEQEEYMRSEQRSWYDCQLDWWSKNLQGDKTRSPEHCDNKLERFQVDRKVVDPKQWWTFRIHYDAADYKKDPCFYDKLEIIYSLLQNKLDLFQIDMCRHRVPPCTYREHLYMDERELRELFQDSEWGSQSKGDGDEEKNWLFEWAEHREKMREKSKELEEEEEEEKEEELYDDEKYRYVEL